MITVRKMATRRVDKKVDIKNKDDEATIYLYGDIGGFFGIDHLEFVKELNAIKAKTIHVRVDSGGGDIFAARAIKTAFLQHPSEIRGHIDGLAASAASFAVLGCDSVEIVDGGYMMIHNAMSFMDIFGYFNKQELLNLLETISKEIELHGDLNESIATDYAKKTGKGKEEFLAYMNATTWFTAKKALEVGLVDSVYDGEVVEGKYDLSIYNNVPEKFRPIGSVDNSDKRELNERDLERDLRDAKYSRNQAKEIVAKVFHNERDARSEPVIQDVRDAQNDAGASQKKTDVVATKKDRTADLLTRAEMVAPSK